WRNREVSQFSGGILPGAPTVVEMLRESRALPAARPRRRVATGVARARSSATIEQHQWHARRSWGGVAVTKPFLGARPTVTKTLCGTSAPGQASMMNTTHSDALVFFGATGDLAYKKIFPSLQAMVKRGNLTVPVVGVAKAGWTLDQLKARARD